MINAHVHFIEKKNKVWHKNSHVSIIVDWILKDTKWGDWGKNETLPVLVSYASEI